MSLGRVGIYDAQRNLVADLGTVDSLTMVDSTTLPPTMVVTDEMQPIPPGGFVAVMDTEMGMQLVKGSATHVVYRRTEVTP